MRALRSQRGLRWLGWVALLVAGIAAEALADESAAPNFPPLPPSARGEAAETALRSASGARVERFDHPAAGGPDEAWFEVEYTVDADLEEELRGVLASMEVSLGHTILLEPRSGEVFAYLSTDPDRFPADRTYPTASLMKIVTAAAALRAEPASLERECRFLGSPYALDAGLLAAPETGGEVHSFRRALAVSNNQCFARVAVNEVGEDRLLGEMRRVGFLEPPAPQHPAGEIEGVRDPLELGFLGSGLAGSYLSPLGAARLAALLVEGELVRPFWIARIRDAQGRSLPVPGRGAPRLVWPPRVAETLRELMADVTESGTAKRAFHDASGAPLLGAIRVSGKTGTLGGRNPDGRYQWFVGVAPVDAPRVAIATVVVQPESRGASAAEVAAASLQGIFCEAEDCRPEHADRLYERIRIREAETQRAIRAHTAALQSARQIAEAHEVVNLDAPPRPLDARLEFPSRLRRKPVDGEIVVLVTLAPSGAVEAAEVASSTLPAFEESVLEQVRGWTFSPPRRNGTAVRAAAHLPIPIQIQ